MTMQMSEYLEADGRNYFIGHLYGEKMFILEPLGLRCKIFSTACYRGWYARWRLVEGRLYINELTVLGDNLPPDLWHICG